MSEIAERIRNLRKEQHMTLKELSEKTELSVSFLSQVENGASSLAITSLKKIAEALDVPIGSFFDVPHQNIYITDMAQQKPFQIEGSSSSFIRMSGDFPNRKMEAMMTIIPPNSPHGSCFNHPGEEFVYVLDGVLLIKLGGEERLIKAGSSIHYPSDIDHQWINPLNTPLKLLTVVTPVIF